MKLLFEKLNVVTFSCLNCLANRPDNAQKTLTGVFTLTKPGEFLNFDLIENLPSKKHIICCVDIYSKYISTFVIENKKSYNIVNALVAIFGQYGVPKKVLFDNGSIFTDRNVTSLLNNYNVRRTDSAPYRSTARSMWKDTMVFYKRPLSS